MVLLVTREIREVTLNIKSEPIPSSHLGKGWGNGFGPTHIVYGQGHIKKQKGPGFLHVA